MGTTCWSLRKIAPGLSLGGRCHDGADGLVLGEDRAVWSGVRLDGERRCSDAQIVMACSMTACFGINNIQCITVNVETHVASVKMDDFVWLCDSVFRQHLFLFDGVGGG